MTGIISIFVLPYEIEDFAITLNALKRNTFHFPNDVIIKFDITVCLSSEMTKWAESMLPANYLDCRARELCNAYLSGSEWQLYIEYGTEILGSMSHRRKSFQSHSNADFFIWLDTDIFLKDTIIGSLINGVLAMKKMNLELYVLTPQIVRQWDATWDILVHPDFSEKPLNYHMQADIIQDCLSIRSALSLQELPQFKFAGGWATVFSSKLLALASLPDQLGHYGPDDTFIMHCCGLLRQKKYDVRQYCIQNALVGEFQKQKANLSMKTIFPPKDRKAEFRSQAEEQFANAIFSFNNRI